MVVDKVSKVKSNMDEESIVKPQTSNLSLGERLKIIANLIIDRIIEQQKLGKLPIKQIQQK